MDLFFQDAENTRVKQFKDIKLSNGVFAGQFQLTKYPLLGKWTVRVYISGKYDMEVVRSFKVEEYVLPKFSVQIVTNGHVVIGDEFIEGFIFGLYTFGHAVEGTVSVFLHGLHHAKISEQIIEINKETLKAKFKLPLVRENINTEVPLSLTAFLTEKYTNETVETFTYIYVHDQSYKIDVLDNEIEFQNNQPHRMKVKVQHWNDSEVVDTETPITLQLRSQSYTSKLDKKGTAWFQIGPDSGTQFKISFKDSRKEVHILSTDNLIAAPNIVNTKCHLQRKNKR